MSYTKSQIEEFSRRLKELPAIEKPAQMSKLETIKALKPEIIAMQKKGYEVEKIAEALTSLGLEITAQTLKSYLQKASVKKNYQRLKKNNLRRMHFKIRTIQKITQIN